MLPSRRTAALVMAALIASAVVLACAIPLPSGPSDEPSPPPGDGPAETEVPEAPPPEPIVVAHVEPAFHLYALDGTLLDTRPADGLSWARPGVVQVVGESIYYVDSGGSSLSGVVRRVTDAGSEELAFTRAEAMASLTFAVSPDESRISWAYGTWSGTAPQSQLWLANLDGSDAAMVLQSDPADAIEDFYVLEPVGWTPDGDLVYAWQVSGIGGYILFFGYSSLYRYDPSTGVTTPLAPVGPSTGAPCWSGVSTDGSYAVGACGADRGVVERELATGTETGFPAFPDQGQAGAGAYSPSNGRLAYAIARGDMDNESGQVIVRLARGAAPTSIASHSPGHFDPVYWADEDRLVVGYWSEGDSMVDLLGIDGSRSPVGPGHLVGLLRPGTPAATGAGLADQVARGELDLDNIRANGEIAGPGIDIVVANPGPTDLDTWIPCGTVFVPDDDEDQRLMVVQEVWGTIPAGGQANLSAYVVCIDSSSSVPDDGAGYALGPMAPDRLRQLAECACREDLAGSADPLEGMSLLLAGWMIASDMQLGEVDSESQAALDQLFGEGAGQALAGMREFFEEPARMWMDRCGIQP
jgi:hypothetical protein